MYKPIKNTIQYFIEMPRWAKQIFAVAIDLILCVICVWLAFYLRLGTPFGYFEQKIYVSLISIIVVLPIFWKLGAYNVIFRYFGEPALSSLVNALLLYTFVFSILLLIFEMPGVPRTVGLIQPLLLLILITFSRVFIAGLFVGNTIRLQKHLSEKKTIIYGAGGSGRQLNAALNANPDVDVVGFFDDKPDLHNQRIDGKIVFNPNSLELVCNELKVQQILLAMPSVSRTRRNKIIERLKRGKVTVRTLPSVSALAQGEVSFSDIRELDIDELLGRERVPPINEFLTKDITEKVVMVTGAGGSVGSELCRQALSLKPKNILLLETNESALYQIHQELLNKQSDVLILPILASVGDAKRINAIFKTWKVDTIYHAAAYKHVPLVEYNVAEGLKNNVFGTLELLNAANKNKVKNFVLVSTDKAVRPTNMMGASKRISELILQAMSSENQFGLKASMVRFGNVLDSSGSVVPKFREQIKQGGPITITHPDITRYFMTIPEAAQLVIQAGAMAEGGEVFLLDMDKPVKITQLASRMVELSGQKLRDENNPEGDIEMKIIGLRPGEKLFEELLIGGQSSGTPHQKIMKASEDFVPWPKLAVILDDLKKALDSGNVEDLVPIINMLIPDYKPTHELADLIFMETRKIK